MNTYRLTSGRLVFDLLFSDNPSITRLADNRFELDSSEYARYSRMRPIRLEEVLEWLKAHKLLSDFQYRRKTITFRLHTELDLDLPIKDVNRFSHLK